MNGFNSQRPIVRSVIAVCLVVVAWLAVPSPAPVRANAPAPTVSRSVALPFAESDGWGVRRFLGGLNTRTHIIQISIACMCLGLFILMRKLN